jgi:tetratricopeptide (TPR) repeat protein
LTGGNPLATKLLIGQTYTLSLPKVLNHFKTKKAESVGALLNYIYAEAWQTLNQNSQRVLRGMLLVSKAGACLEQIAAITNMDEGETGDCLLHLTKHLLVNINGTLKERWYSLHSLTQIFLADLNGEEANLADSFNQMIVNNAHYWLIYLKTQTHQNDKSIDEVDIQGIFQALYALITHFNSETWHLTKTITSTLHPYIERRGYWTEWEDFLTKLIALSAQHHDILAEAEWLTGRGAIQRQRGLYKKAITSYKQALKLYRQTKEQTGQARAMSNLGDLYRLQGTFWRAMIFCQCALRLFEDLNDIERLAATQNHIGLIYLAQPELDKAEQHLIEAKLLWYSVTNNTYGLAKVFHNLGEVYRLKGCYQEALDYLHRAIEHYHMAGDTVYVARTNINVGNVYLNQKKFDMAIMTYSQTEVTLKKAGCKPDLGMTRHNLGIAHTYLKNWEVGIDYFKYALDIWEELEDTWHLANTLGDFARLYLAQENTQEAQIHLQKALTLTKDSLHKSFVVLHQSLLKLQEDLDHLKNKEVED